MESIISTPRQYEQAIIGATFSEDEIPLVDNNQAHLDALMTQALRIAHNTPDVRKDRVEAIRDQIARGEYEIDIERIAESLIKENPALFED